MEVTVRLFGQLRERAGTDELPLELPPGARAADALAELSHVIGGCPTMVAINRGRATKDRLLHHGDEIALIPPVKLVGVEEPERGAP